MLLTSSSGVLGCTPFVSFVLAFFPLAFPLCWVITDGAVPDDIDLIANKMQYLHLLHIVTAWLTMRPLWSRPFLQDFPTNPLSFWLTFWAVAVFLIIQAMKLLLHFILALFAIAVFWMSGIFKCGELCNRSFLTSRGLSHHRRSCQIYIRTRTELRNIRVELYQSNRSCQERPAKRARVSSIDYNDLVHPLDMVGFVWSLLCHMI